MNTGGCITGDVDCDGDPGNNGPITFGGADRADLEGTEFVVVVFDFGFNNSAGGFTSNPTSGGTINADVTRGFLPGFHAIAGVTASVTDTIANARVTRHGPTPARNTGRGVDINSAGVAMTILGGGPSAAFSHFIFSIAGFSQVQTQTGLGLTIPSGVPATATSGNFDPADPCISVFVNMGSGEDGNIGEDSTVEATNCVSPSPTPSPTRTPTPSPSPSPTPTPTRTPTPTPTPTRTPTPSPTPTSSPSAGASPSSVPAPTCAHGGSANRKPQFVRELPVTSSDCLEMRVCLGDGTDNGNIGITSVTLETSDDGAVCSLQPRVVS